MFTENVFIMAKKNPGKWIKIMKAQNIILQDNKTEKNTNHKHDA